MIIELSEIELEMIRDWYNSAAGESASFPREAEHVPTFLALLQTLGV